MTTGMYQYFMEWRDANTGRVASVSPACVTCNGFPPTNSVVYRNTHRGRETDRQTGRHYSFIHPFSQSLWSTTGTFTTPPGPWKSLSTEESNSSTIAKGGRVPCRVVVHPRGASMSCLPVVQQCVPVFVVNRGRVQAISLNNKRRHRRRDGNITSQEERKGRNAQNRGQVGGHHQLDETAGPVAWQEQ